MCTEFPQNPFRSTVEVVDKLVSLDFSNDVREANKNIVEVLEPKEEIKEAEEEENNGQ